MTKVTHNMYSCDTCCMSREMMEMDGLECAKCQKSKRRDMDDINRIVNDNGTKDEQLSSSSKRLKTCSRRRKVQNSKWLRFCDFLERERAHSL